MCKQQSNSESESDTEISSSILKYFKLDTYLPGNKFQSNFIHKDVDSTKKKNLKNKLQKRLKNIEKEFAKLTRKKALKRQRRKRNTLHILKLQIWVCKTEVTPYVKISQLSKTSSRISRSIFEFKNQTYFFSK